MYLVLMLDLPVLFTVMVTKQRSTVLDIKDGKEDSATLTFSYFVHTCVTFTKNHSW